MAKKHEKKKQKKAKQLSKLLKKYVQLCEDSSKNIHQELTNTLQPAREKLLRALPNPERPFFERFFSSIDSMAMTSDFNALITKSADFARQIDFVTKAYSKDELGDTLIQKQGYFNQMPVGISLQGGNSFQYFLNPWAPYTHFADNHWAVSAAMGLICSEIRQQQFNLLPIKKVSTARHQEVVQLFSKFKIKELYERMIQHMLAYRQVVVLPKKHMLNGLHSFEVLRMDRLAPIWNLQTERVIGWEYYINHSSRFLSKDSVLQLHRASMRHPDIGVPPAAPMATDLEADLGASTLNNRSVLQAGMLGVVIATKEMPGMTAKQNEQLAARLEAEISNSHSGYLNPHSVVVSNLIENVHRLSKAGDFDGSFLKFRNDIVGKGVSTVYQLPPNAMNVSAKSGGVYEAKGLSNRDIAKINNSVSDVSDPVVNFLNEVVLPKWLNIDDFKIVTTGRSWTSTSDGAQASYLASKTGVPLTGNEHRVYFFGAPPLPPDDPRGYEYIDNSMNRDALSEEPGQMQLDPLNPIPGLILPRVNQSDDGDESDDEDE